MVELSMSSMVVYDLLEDAEQAVILPNTYFVACERATAVRSVGRLWARGVTFGQKCDFRPGRPLSGPQSRDVPCRDQVILAEASSAQFGSNEI